MTPKSNHFDVPGSPLHGRPVPTDWNKLDLSGKKNRLVRIGLARSWKDACSKLGEHAAAVKKLREAHRSRDPKPRQGRDGKD